jgi:uncharacterized protein YndB with AHSA1/START domain
VYAAFTDAPSLQAWWGPHGFTNPVCEADPRPGGAIRIHMRGHDGTVYPMTGSFVALDPPKRLVTLTQAIGPDGAVELSLRTLYGFAAYAGKTQFDMQIHILERTEIGKGYLEGMEIGWNQSLERLGAFVERGERAS